MSLCLYMAVFMSIYGIFIFRIFYIYMWDILYLFIGYFITIFGMLYLYIKYFIFIFGIFIFIYMIFNLFFRGYEDEFSLNYFKYKICI